MVGYSRMRECLRQNLCGLTKQEYEILKWMSHESKDLYNEVLYEKETNTSLTMGNTFNYYNAYKRLKDESENYEVLPSQAAQ
ncbi:MAG: IS605 OrfB-like transposable element containing RNAse H-like and Zn finger domain [Candidatus Methanohalarchaeum thermophilum]|uniref:IS605 OrfB-like transposable element containing RNAse H-like and Zn finger domain n=1 Tax=Methanohalarchaeum thermophilum TaxID=1903181 RepID=A0A1Q6DV17_METT1|nr:MAG: IS605 OrfB-like transposable element containing RNAse H-like and Zn finger domain [Candidatus Methanohalarchaeum thermophilum]